MKKLLLGLIAGTLFATTASAQSPAGHGAPGMTQQQAQQAMMLRQMQMMAVMFDYRRSKLGFDDTVNAIVNNASKRNWQKPEVSDMQTAIQQSGDSDAKRMKVVATCPADANARLAKVSEGKLPPLPCRYTVFEDKSGKVYVVRLNTPMFAKSLKGSPAMVLADISAEEDSMLKAIVD